jgi:hypothetical protein
MAAICAIPFPIVPEPTTPIREIFDAIWLSVLRFFYKLNSFYGGKSKGRDTVRSDRYTYLMNYSGICHCGNISVEFVTEFPASKLELRRCVCSFCIKHGAITATDPQGSVKITIASEKNLSQYRFGLRTADFIVCSVCGVYVAAMLKQNGEVFATLNINTLKNVNEFTSPPVKVNYESETASEKVSRRKEKWTPAVLEITGK